MSDPMASLRDRAGILDVALVQWANRGTSGTRQLPGGRAAQRLTPSMPCFVISSCCAGVLSGRSAKPMTPHATGLPDRAVARIGYPRVYIFRPALREAPKRLPPAGGS